MNFIKKPEKDHENQKMNLETVSFELKNEKGKAFLDNFKSISKNYDLFSMPGINKFSGIIIIKNFKSQSGRLYFKLIEKKETNILIFKLSYFKRDKKIIEKYVRKLFKTIDSLD